MAALLYLKEVNFAVPPGRNILRAAEYADLVEAGDILARARAEAESIRRKAAEAYEAEKARGYEEGLTEGKMEMAMTMLDSLNAGVDYLAGVESTVVELVMNAVSKIIDGFNDEERVLGLVRKALGYVRTQKRVVLRVCPEDGELVSARLAELAALYPGIGIIDVTHDSRLSRGDCFLESDMGLINASLPTQIEGIRRAFDRRLRRGEE